MWQVCAFTHLFATCKEWLISPIWHRARTVNHPCHLPCTNGFETILMWLCPTTNVSLYAERDSPYSRFRRGMVGIGSQVACSANREYVQWCHVHGGDHRHTPAVRSGEDLWHLASPSVGWFPIQQLWFWIWVLISEPYFNWVEVILVLVRNLLNVSCETWLERVFIPSYMGAYLHFPEELRAYGLPILLVLHAWVTEFDGYCIFEKNK